MKNSILPISIFLVLFIFVCFANSSLISLCDNLIDRVEKIEESIEYKDYETAGLEVDELIDYINSKAIITAVYINHADYDNFIDEAQELKIYTKCEDYMESLIAATSLKEFAENIRHLYKTSIENIF